ncbi:cell division control protein 6 homolog [Anguilla rostrata]|uniref:cell division control protein 6 homolog n=1 Tax=Anguilla rostrata TaxID=7938 RepID=UPI0030D0E1C2
MPSTRSQSQPTLQFPKRKSVGSRPKDATRPKQGSIFPPDPKTTTKILQSKSPRSAALNPKRAPDSPRAAVQPLSPRKRMGDENGCNLPPTLLGSPPKQKCPELSSPRKLNFDENTPVLSHVHKELISPKHPIADLASPNAHSTLHQPQDTPASASVQSEKKAPAAQLYSEEESCYHSVKQALHTAVPEHLLSRDKECASIRSFLTDKVKLGIPASLYISGAPGTGKTACLNCILQEMEDQLQSVQKVIINCMRLRSSQSIFPLLVEQLGASRGHSVRCLENLLTTTGPPVLLVLDEMDQLDSKAQDVLYTIFEWPYLPKSRLCLIGIANALDLTDRILPRLQSRPHCRPLLLHFPPYSRLELIAIMQDRLTQVSGEVVLDAAAVQFCARKVSAVSGDARKALDICRRAVEIVESDARRRKLNLTSDSKGSHVSVPQVARVLSEVYGDRMATGGGEGEHFPLQQKLLVCCLLLLTKHGKSRVIPLGKLHEVYSRLCVQRQVGSVGQGECLSLCSLLESRGIFSMKKAKEARLTKVSLKIEERDVENALKDRTLLGSILATGLP